jgi:hypothetical protein
LRGGKKGAAQQENRPRGPIKEKSGGRIYAVDDLDEGAPPADLDDVATSAPANGADEKEDE